ncbi:MAG: hypothetical protein HYV33_05565 [Candidatus Kerfeldbacteria bacterium]|nr:hypothetical protein [Candidatus Kerfeldbacteria bacterium]
MPKKKLKTVKTISKRIKVSHGKKKTLLMRSSGQDHFNARERGKTTRKKRRHNTVARVNERNVRRALNG